MFMALLSLAFLADTTGVLCIPVTVSETLAVTVSGEGPALVVIPGLSGSAYAFRQLAPLLVAAGHRVVIIEPLGMGTSGRPALADYTLEAQASRVASVLDTLGIRGALVLGHAVGGSIALRLALARPDLVRSVVLEEGGGAEQAGTTGLRRAMTFAPFIKLFGGQGMVRRQFRKSLVKSSADPAWITDDVIRGYTVGMSRNFDQTIKGYRGMVEAHDENALVPRLGLMHLPVLLVLGGTPHPGGPSSTEVEELSSGLPALSTHFVAMSGHHIHEEQPRELADLITAFDVPLP